MFTLLREELMQERETQKNIGSCDSKIDLLLCQEAIRDLLEDMAIRGCLGENYKNMGHEISGLCLSSKVHMKCIYTVNRKATAIRFKKLKYL